MPRWTPRFRPSLPRPGRRGWVQPGNAITRAIEQELETGRPAHLPLEPDPVPAPVISSAEEQSSGRPSTAA